MKRALWAIFAILVVTVITHYVANHPGLEKLDRLEGELAKLQAENEALAGENERLEVAILALRDDPRLAERRARESAGLARPHEVIYQFEEPQVPLKVAVQMVVTTNGIELAGKKVALSDLTAALDELRVMVPGAHVVLDVKEGVDPIERQRIEDVLAAAENRSDATAQEN